MPDDRTLELLNLEIDGELSASDRADLSRRLLNDPLARAARDDLRRTCDELDAMPVAEPPAGLRERVLAGLPLATNGGGQPSRRFLSSASTLRYAAAFVGGLLVSAIAFEAMRDQPGISIEETAGTMANPPKLAKGMVADTVKIDLPEVRGKVSLFRSASTRVVEFDLAAKLPVEVAVTHDGHEARLSGFGPDGSAGNQRYALVIDGPGQQSEPIGLEFLVSGTVIHRDVLGAPVSR